MLSFRTSIGTSLSGVYSQVPLVGQIWVFGYSEKSSLVAIVVPDAEEAAKWAKKQEGLKGDETLQQLCGLQQMKTFLVKVSDRIALQESDFIVLPF